MTKNKFINNSGSTGSTGSAILKFIIGVGLILGVCAFVMVLTTKCECKDKFKSSEVFHTLGTFPTEEGLKEVPSERNAGLLRLLQAKKDFAKKDQTEKDQLVGSNGGTFSAPAGGELGAGALNLCSDVPCTKPGTCRKDPANWNRCLGCIHDNKKCGSTCDWTFKYCKGETVFAPWCESDKCMATYCFSGKGHWPYPFIYVCD